MRLLYVPVAQLARYVLMIMQELHEMFYLNKVVCYESCSNFNVLCSLIVLRFFVTTQLIATVYCYISVNALNTSITG